jgi:SAM-dependent methyltransferase
MLKKDIEKRHAELLSLRSNNNWSDVRTSRKFKLKPIEYGFGTRNTFVPIEKKFNEDLQDSRGNSVNDDQTLEDYISNIKNSVTKLNDADVLRITELENLINKNQIEIFGKKGKSICEIGFRNPKLLNFYKSKIEKTVGFDISKINVDVANELGFNCHVWDLNDLTFSHEDKFDLAICYHVLEHTFDPLASLKVIKSNLNKDAILHIEVPIEPGVPRINFGHLIALEFYDLKNMLEICQFQILNISHKTHPGGPEIERIIAKNI